MKQLLDRFDSLDAKPFGQLVKLKGNYMLGSIGLTFLRLQNSPGAHPASIGELQLRSVSFRLLCYLR